MTSKVEKVVDAFKNSINFEKEDYTLKELYKLLEESFKSVHGKKKSPTEKKPPSAYNMFIRDEIAKIKSENPSGVPPNEYMKMAAERWKAHKENLSA